MGAGFGMGAGRQFMSASSGLMVDCYYTDSRLRPPMSNMILQEHSLDTMQKLLGVDGSNLY